MNDTPRALPARPDLDQLRRQARELSRQTGQSLTEAQRDLARLFGFASWTRLKRHVEELTGRRTRLESFVEAALAGRLDDADAILPEVRDEPAAIYLTGGQPEELTPNEPLAPKDWPPLLYVCYSRYLLRPETRPALVALAQRLLEAGAAPNAFWIHSEFPDSPETPLYGASGLNNVPELTELLLRHGANPTDNEAIYHSTEHRDLVCLRLILEAGGSPRDGNYVAHMLDHHDPEGLRLMLEHYGEPDDKLHEALHHALIRRSSPDELGMLLDAGADPNRVEHGATAYVRARLLKLTEQAEFLASRGATTEMSEAERQTVAAVEGQPIPPMEVPLSLVWVPTYLAEMGDAAGLKRLFDAGFDPNGAAEWGRTPLHNAGWMGHAEAVRLTLDRGGRLDIKDPHHNGTPVNWTVAGAAWKANPAGDHASALRAMLEAGGAEHCSPDWVLGLSKEMPEILSLLESYGVKRSEPARSQRRPPRR